MLYVTGKGAQKAAPLVSCKPLMSVLQLAPLFNPLPSSFYLLFHVASYTSHYSFCGGIPAQVPTLPTVNSISKRDLITQCITASKSTACLLTRCKEGCMNGWMDWGRELRGKVDLESWVGRKRGSRHSDRYDKRGWEKGVKVREMLRGAGRERQRERGAGSFNWSFYSWIHHYFMCCLTFVRLTNSRLLQLFDIQQGTEWFSS